MSKHSSKRRHLLAAMGGAWACPSAWALPPQDVPHFFYMEADASGRLYVGSNRGLFQRDPGSGAWVEVSPRPGMRVHGLCVTPGGDVAVDGGSEIHVRAQRSTTWVEWPRPLGQSHVLHDGQTWVLLSDDGMLRASNGRWVKASLPKLPRHHSRPAFASVWGRYVLATPDGLYESTDQGEHWQPSPGSVPVGAPDRLLASPGGGLYASTAELPDTRENQAKSRWPQVFVKDTPTTDWRQFSLAPLLDHRQYSARLLGAYRQTAYVQLGGKQSPTTTRWFRVADGRQWTEIDRSFTQGAVPHPKMLVTPDRCYAWTGGVIFESADEGAHWSKFLTHAMLPLR